MLFEIFWWLYNCPCKYKRKIKKNTAKVEVIIPKVIFDTELKNINEDFFIIQDLDLLP
jgi:hypothetical protein